jgi:hypothetical protein
MGATSRGTSAAASNRTQSSSRKARRLKSISALDHMEAHRLRCQPRAK